MSRKRRHEEIAIPNVKIEDLKPGGGGRGRTKWGGSRSSAAAQERSPPFAQGTVPISHEPNSIRHWFLLAYLKSPCDGNVMRQRVRSRYSMSLDLPEELVGGDYF